MGDLVAATMQLTVKSDVVEGEDNWPVGLGRALHGAVHLSKWSLHILLLWGTKLCETTVIPPNPPI